jgi:NAD(P)-dependent dehydrogenase (short-subunit alcohol dehydrogenase family)
LRETKYLLSDKIILVTGAAQGIGEAGCRLFADYGATVIVTDINESGIQSNATDIQQQNGNAEALALDVTSTQSVTDAVQHIVDRHGRIDGLFHNAMSAAYVNNNDNLVTDLDDEVWSHILDLTLTGSFRVMKAVGRVMLKQQTGSMVFTATVDAVIAQAGIDAYSAAKGGVVSLARSAAAGLSPQGVRINSICPSFVTTPDQAAFLENPEHRANFDSMHLLPISAPEDIAEFAAFLLSDNARSVTGATHMVDSGYSSFKGKMDLRDQVSTDRA